MRLFRDAAQVRNGVGAERAGAIGVEHPAKVTIEHAQVQVVRDGEVRMLVILSLAERCHFGTQVGRDRLVTDVVGLVASKTGGDE